MRTKTRRTAGWRRSRLPAVGLAAILAAGAACSSLLEVDIPGQVPVDELDNPALANTLRIAALGEFECAYAQYVVTTGILADEFIISGLTINSNIWGWRGDVEIRSAEGSCPNNTGATGYGVYVPLQRARFLAVDGYNRIESFPDAEVTGKATMLAQLAAYAGYSYTLLGEGFCEMAIDEGPLMTREQVWAEAETWFTDAIARAQAVNDASLENMALVGRARVRLNLGNNSGADADAALVPAGFVRNATYSTATPRRQNRVFNSTYTADDISVSLAYRGLTVGGQPDWRVIAADSGRIGNDGVTPQWDQEKYLSAASPIPIASYTEAQLILAEVRGGAQAITILNDLRANASPDPLPALTPAEEADIANTVVEERRRWLFAEGHRLNDMLRLGIPFPSGLNHKNQSYGSVTCMPLPDVERLNNPNID